MHSSRIRTARRLTVSQDRLAFWGWGEGLLPSKAGLPLGVCLTTMPWGRQTPVLWTEDSCETITFPQLRLRAVINVGWM